MESCPTQAVLPLVGLAAEKVIRARYITSLIATNTRNAANRKFTLKSQTSPSECARYHDALILVDLQNDFLPGGAMAVPHGDDVIPVANRLQPLFDLVVTTRDWHPPEHGSFVTSHPGSQPGEVVQLAGVSQIVWPVHCVRGTPGAELPCSLQPHCGRQEVLKGQELEIDSYSGFIDTHGRHTALDGLLRRYGVQRVFIMGLATDYCVKCTVLDAVALGYETVLIEDGCRGVNLHEGDVDRAIQAMREAGATVIQSSDVEHMRESGDERDGGASSAPSVDVLAETPHLRLLRRGHWDYVARSNGSGIVAIMALTPENELLLVEQFRPPLARSVIELPAGIVGDVETAKEESFEQAAVRELLEETGYQAGNVRCVLTSPSSAGLTDEQITFVQAARLRHVDQGGGDASESITVHRVPFTGLDDWLRRQANAGRLISARVFTGIYLLEAKW
ncbi:MAG: bifunctional nicotinamidase/pyrazinamidase [Planctomycetota bacterium]